MKRTGLPILILWITLGLLALPPAYAGSLADDLKEQQELLAEHQTRAELLQAESARIQKGQTDLQSHEEQFRRDCPIDAGNLDKPDPGPQCRARAEEIAKFMEELALAAKRFQAELKTFTEAENKRLSDAKELSLQLKDLNRAPPDEKFGTLCSTSCSHLCSTSDADCPPRLAKCKSDCIATKQVELENHLKIADQIWQEIQINK